MMGYASRQRESGAQIPSDIMPGDWVVMVTGGPKGYVKSLDKDGFANVVWLGCKPKPEKVECSLLIEVGTP